MSAGPLSDAKYEDSLLNVFSAKVQPETLAFSIGANANSSPTAAATEGRVKISAGNGEIGTIPRKVGFLWDSGQTPDGYSVGEILYIPILTESVYAAAELGAAATYLGGTGTIVSRLGEIKR